MKKVFSSILILLLLLNVMGYYGVFMVLEYRSDIAMGFKFDAAEYDRAETIEFKIPLTVPYAGDDDRFMRVSGKFESQGEFFQMIKQKLAHDTLTVICLRDPESKRINAALADYVKSFSDKTSASAGKVLHLPTLIKDYAGTEVRLGNDAFGWENEIAAANFSRSLIPSYFSSILHPPERA